MKRILLRLFSHLPFFDLDEYERQVEGEAAAIRSAETVAARNQRDFQVNDLHDRLIPKPPKGARP